jgi:uncharacterized membrane protein
MKKYIVGFSLLLSLSSCNYAQSNSLALDPINSGNAGEPVDLGAAPDQVDFAVIMEKVIAKNCLSCHSDSGGNRGHLNLETYQNVSQAAADIKELVLDRSMPPRRAAPLTDTQIQMLVTWIDAGAPEKLNTEPAPQPTPLPELPPVVGPEPPPVFTPEPAPEPAPVPVPVGATFEMVFKQVIQPSCLKCHSGEGKGDVNLETYQNVLKFKKEVRETIADGSMPRRSKLTDDQKKLILDWIDAGAPEFEIKK